MFYEKSIADLVSEEPDLESRIEAAKKRATAIVSGNVENVDQLFSRLVITLSKYYKIPFHSEFFENLTLDELLLEVFLLTEQEKTPETAISEAIKENREELEDLFKDFGDLGQPVFSAEEEAFIENQGKDFMEQGFAAFDKMNESE